MPEGSCLQAIFQLALSRLAAGLESKLPLALLQSLKVLYLALTLRIRWTGASSALVDPVGVEVIGFREPLVGVAGIIVFSIDQ